MTEANVAAKPPPPHIESGRIREMRKGRTKNPPQEFDKYIDDIREDKDALRLLAGKCLLALIEHGVLELEVQNDDGEPVLYVMPKEVRDCYLKRLSSAAVDAVIEHETVEIPEHF